MLAPIAGACSGDGDRTAGGDQGSAQVSADQAAGQEEGGASTGDGSGGDTADAVTIEVEGDETDGAAGVESDETGEAAGVESDETDGEGEAGTEGVAVDELGGAELEEFLARRYEAFWLAFDRAREAPSADPSTGHPGLADLATGVQLEQAYTELADLVASGQAHRDPDVAAVPGLDHEQSIRIRVEQVDDGAANLVACLINDRVSYEVDGGSVINDQVVTVLAEATMVRTDGTWKLLRSRAVGLDPGVGGCWSEGTNRYPW